MKLLGSQILLAVGLFPAIMCHAAGAETAHTFETGPAPIIDSVEIITENVFDFSDPRYDNFIFRLANKMHIVTRASIVRRELLLGPGDIYDTALINESIRNLRGLPYLFKADILLKKDESRKNIMVVNTSDRWSTITGVSFHRGGRRDDLQIGIEENNLLGCGIFMSHDYFILEDDRNYYQMEIRDNRFAGQKMSLGLVYSDNPRVGRLALSAGKPYYSLSQKWAGNVCYSRVNKRVDYYINEILAARDRLNNKGLQLTNNYRIGPDHIKYYFIALYGYNDINWRGRSFSNTEMYGLETTRSILPEEGRDSTIHYVQAGFRLQQIRFAEYTRLNRFCKPEDVNHGLDVTVSAGAGFPRRQERYQYYALAPQLTTSYKSSLLIFGVFGQQWQAGDRVLRRKINYYFKGYGQCHRNHTFVMGISYLSDRLQESGLTLYLDEDNGLRGYPAYYSSGENRLIINLEHRYFSNVEVLSVGLGGVAFVDIGNVWTREGCFSIRDTRTSFGFGLRFGITRSTQAEIIRIDFAYAPKLENWQISVGTGQFF